jgi:hypothetical protein
MDLTTLIPDDLIILLKFFISYDDNKIIANILAQILEKISDEVY